MYPTTTRALFGQQKITIQFVAINELWQLLLLDIFLSFCLNVDDMRKFNLCIFQNE